MHIQFSLDPRVQVAKENVLKQFSLDPGVQVAKENVPTQFASQKYKFTTENTPIQFTSSLGVHVYERKCSHRVCFQSRNSHF